MLPEIKEKLVWQFIEFSLISINCSKNSAVLSKKILRENKSLKPCVAILNASDAGITPRRYVDCNIRVIYADITKNVNLKCSNENT